MRSVTRTVEVADPFTLKVTDCAMNHMCKEAVERVTGCDLASRGSYEVTYSLDPRGAFKVSRRSALGGLIIQRVRAPKLGGIVVCFLPDDRSWVGKRLSRKVTPL